MRDKSIEEKLDYIQEHATFMRAQLDEVRAALGNGADEGAWPPGMTVAQAIERLRNENEALRKCAAAHYDDSDCGCTDDKPCADFQKHWEGRWDCCLYHAGISERVSRRLYKVGSAAWDDGWVKRQLWPSQADQTILGEAITDMRAAKAEADKLRDLCEPLRPVADMLQYALDDEMELPCPKCKIPMPCNGDAGWICGSSICILAGWPFGIEPYRMKGRLADALGEPGVQP